MIEIIKAFERAEAMVMERAVEIENLRHDIEWFIDIAASQQAEIERLRALLQIALADAGHSKDDIERTLVGRER